MVELHWGPAVAPVGQQLLYNVFWGHTLATLWDAPKGITESETVLVPNLTPTDGYFFSVRATWYPEEVTVSDFEPLTGSLGAYPTETVTTANYSATGTLSLLVNSTVGWPASGYLAIDSEILQYSAKTATSFTIVHRDVFDFGQQEAHPSSTSIRFWEGIEDKNHQYYHSVATWDRGEIAPFIPVIGEAQYMQGADGYRTHAVDNLTEDHSNYEIDNEEFQTYPFCGYRATNFVDLYSRRVCNTYAGGRQDGFGGVDANAVNLQRQELLLGVTGEPFALLRRKWTGRQCVKISHRHEHPHARCGKCFVPGTLVRTESGYRPIEEIRIGEKVLTSDGRFRPVTNVFESHYSGDLVELRTSTTSSTILATPEHPYMVMRGTHHDTRSDGCGPQCTTYIENRDTGTSQGSAYQLPSGNWQARTRTIGEEEAGRISLGSYPTAAEANDAIARYKVSKKGHELQWDIAENLTEKDWLVSVWPTEENDIETVKVPENHCDRNPNPHKPRRGVEEFVVDEDFLWMAGLYLAEGCSSKTANGPSSRGGKVVFALHVKEIDFQNRLVTFFERHGYNSKVTLCTKGGLGVKVVINSTTLAGWFYDWFGHRCYNKRIPEELMRLPCTKTWALLNGIYDGDGNKRCNEIGQTSEILSLQITELLHRVGEQPTVHQQISSHLTPRGNKRRTCYVNSWAEDTLVHTNRKNRWKFEGKELSRIKELGHQQYDGYVYNIEVEEDHTYVVQGILVHNCFGTTFESGYDRYLSSRDLRPNTDNVNGMIMVRLAPYKNDLERSPDRGLTQSDEITAWTMAIPQIRDSDILVRYVFEPNTMEILGEEFRYEVLHVTRNRTILGNDGQQQMVLRKLDRTEIIYSFPVTTLPGVPGGSGSSGSAGTSTGTHLTSTSHNLLDTLVHNIAENYFEEYIYSGAQVVRITIWTTSAKVLKIRESLFSYSGNKIVQEVNIQYSSAGVEVQRLTIDYQYSGTVIVSSTAVRS